MNIRERFTILLGKYTLDELTPEEHSEFMALAASGEFDDLIGSSIESTLQKPSSRLEGANLPAHRSAHILHQIISAEKQNQIIIPAASGRVRTLRWVAAAAFIGIIATAVFIFSKKDEQPFAPGSGLMAGLDRKANNTDAPIRLAMEDGTVITLQPGSVVHHPHHFETSKREIYLEGEAFFDVKKNAARPFFVYNQNIVTHVLGTSFNVRLNKLTNRVEVSVRTGKVEVYENPSLAGNKTVSNGVILLPNQKVVYDAAVREFVPSLVERPMPVITENNTEKPNEDLVFEESPLRKVLPSLEKNYGIEIIAENEDIYNCLFTGDVHAQDLYTRLDVICEAVGATYEVKGTRILIKGRGCK